MVRIRSECGHCGARLDLTVDSDLRWKARQRDARPLVFEPHIDWSHFQGRNIIGDY